MAKDYQLIVYQLVGEINFSESIFEKPPDRKNRSTFALKSPPVRKNLPVVDRYLRVFVAPRGSPI